MGLPSLITIRRSNWILMMPVPITTEETQTRDMGNYEEAIADYNKAIDLDQNYIGPYRSRGDLQLHLKQYAAAIATYTEVIRLEPNDANLYSNRGVAKNLLNKPDEALIDLNEAIRI